MIFCCYYLATLLFFSQKLCCIGVFVPVLYRIFTGFAPGFEQKSKKI